MVVFTCGHCGESVQKPKVEKHYLTKCRNRNPNLSCMDCFKDFLGHDYESHTKCITEEERYSGKGFMAKEKKGEKKQEAWLEMVQSVLDEQKGAPKNVIRIIETISKHNNTPRKKPKFYNFVKNVCGQKTGAKDIEQAWDMLSVKLAALSTSNQQNDNKNGSVNGKSEPNSEDEQNGDVKEEDGKKNGQKGDISNEIITETNTENGECNDVENNGESNKKLSKKERKEEKKRRKYEAELQSAEQPPDDDEEEEESTKKGKKKKNKSESNDDITEETDTKNNKNKKRKRQDTAVSIPEIIENGVAIEDSENVPVISKEKTVKKKLKVKEDEADESICLHDQNVAKIEGLSMKPEKFNWHAVIMSVLQKKGNEVKFKRLQSKVLMEYSEATGQEVDDRIAEKFIKKLKSAPNVRVDKNKVLLLD